MLKQNQGRKTYVKTGPACTLINKILHKPLPHTFKCTQYLNFYIISLMERTESQIYEVNFWVLNPQVTILRAQNFCCNKPYK